MQTAVKYYLRIKENYEYSTVEDTWIYHSHKSKNAPSSHANSEHNIKYIILDKHAYLKM